MSICCRRFASSVIFWLAAILELTAVSEPAVRMSALVEDLANIEQSIVDGDDFNIDKIQDLFSDKVTELISQQLEAEMCERVTVAIFKLTRYLMKFKIS